MAKSISHMETFGPSVMSLVYSSILVQLNSFRLNLNLKTLSYGTDHFCIGWRYIVHSLYYGKDL